MAVYAATITSPQRHAERIGNSAIGIYAGSCNLSNYNTTLAEITAITGKFLSGGFLTVTADGETSNGYTVKWDTAGKAFKAWKTAVTASSAALSVSGTPLGSNAAPTLTLSSGNPATHPVGVISGGNVVSDALYTGITGVQAPAFTGSNTTMTGPAPTITTSAAADAQLASDVNAGTFNFIAVGQMG